MKYIIILGDGMADYPIPELNGKTPLMVANKPNMDRIAREGVTGLFQTIEADMSTGSAVANLSVLGYDPRTTFQGRGVLEAASLGVQLTETDMAMRVNLICVEDEKIRSHSAGHISNDDAGHLIDDLKIYFKDWNIQLIQGLSYRHLLVIPGGNPNLKCAPPHDHVGRLLKDILIKPLSPDAQASADLLNRLIQTSQQFLNKHPLNQKRISQGMQPANALWPWSPGKRPTMIKFKDRFGVKGAAISAVDLIKGLAIYAGMDVIKVMGATGLYNTNYEGKAAACIKALENHDFVYVHVEAPDEAGHDRNLQLKIKCIEDLDQRLIKIILNELEKRKMDFVITLLPDHATPIVHGAHVRDPIPVAIRNPNIPADDVVTYDEESVKSGALGLLRGSQFIEIVMEKLPYDKLKRS
jgi:2,3-bisphosphoglycerate-independent phosphoglycerate mutase